MKHTKIKLLKLATILSIFMGISAPVTVQASLVDAGSSTLNGNSFVDPFAGFGINIAGLTTNVDFVNGNAVTLVYNPTLLPLTVGADIETINLRVTNNSSLPWLSLKIEFIGLAAANADLYDDSPIITFPNPITGTDTVSGTTVDAAFSFSIPGRDHLTIFNSIENFAANQNGAQFTVRITPVAAAPVPAAVWMFGTGLLALFGGGKFTRRKLNRI